MEELRIGVFIDHYVELSEECANEEFASRFNRCMGIPVLMSVKKTSNLSAAKEEEGLSSSGRHDSPAEAQNLSPQTKEENKDEYMCALLGIPFEASNETILSFVEPYLGDIEHMSLVSYSEDSSGLLWQSRKTKDRDLKPSSKIEDENEELAYNVDGIEHKDDMGITPVIVESTSENSNVSIGLSDVVFWPSHQSYCRPNSVLLVWMRSSLARCAFLSVYNNLHCPVDLQGSPPVGPGMTAYHYCAPCLAVPLEGALFTDVNSSCAQAQAQAHAKIQAHVLEMPPNAQLLPTCVVCLRRLHESVSLLTEVAPSLPSLLLPLSLSREFGRPPPPGSRESSPALGENVATSGSDSVLRDGDGSGSGEMTTGIVKATSGLAKTSAAAASPPSSSDWVGRCFVCDMAECRMPTRNMRSCSTCSVRDNIWICLICGHRGCGRYTFQHAKEHFHFAPGHSLSLELATGRIWDYQRDDFVHLEGFPRRGLFISQVGSAGVSDETNRVREAGIWHPSEYHAEEAPSADRWVTTCAMKGAAAAAASSQVERGLSCSALYPRKVSVSAPAVSSVAADAGADVDANTDAGACTPKSSERSSLLIREDPDFSHKFDKYHSLRIDGVEDEGESDYERLGGHTRDKLSGLLSGYEHALSEQINEQILYYERLLASRTREVLERKLASVDKTASSPNPAQTAQDNGLPSGIDSASQVSAESLLEEISIAAAGDGGEDAFQLAVGYASSSDAELAQIEALKIDISQLESEHAALRDETRQAEAVCAEVKRRNTALLRQQKEKQTRCAALQQRVVELQARTESESAELLQQVRDLQFFISAKQQLSVESGGSGGSNGRAEGAGGEVVHIGAPPTPVRTGRAKAPKKKK
jgi:BRCA1-associated protein